MRTEMFDDQRTVSILVADVADAVEAELEVLVAGVEDRVMAGMQAMTGATAGALHEVLRGGVSAAVRDALARLRYQTELPHELLPELIELARVCADSRCEPARSADAWLSGHEAFWDGFEVA